MTGRLIIKRTYFALIALLFSSLAAGQILSVSSVDKAMVKPTDRIALYALPQTILEVRCHISYRQQLMGPYAQYARELLGKEGIQHETVQWTIDSVSIVPVTVFDASQVYVVRFGKKADYQTLENLAKQGFIIFPLHNKYPSAYPDSIQNFTRGTAEWSVLDLPFTTNIEDTIYQVVVKDSLLIRQPVVKRRTAAATQYERAKEVAKLIQQIHQRRLELILSEDEPVPANEKSLQWMISQLRQKEETFLQLFLGKTVTHAFIYSFSYTPSAGKIQPAEIFRFSPLRGISGKNDPSALPVYITLEPTNTITTLRDYQSLFTSFTTPVIIYRVPEVAGVSVTWGNRMLMRSRLPVYQLGALVPWMPAE